MEFLPEKRSWLPGPWIGAALALVLFALSSSGLPVPEESAGYLAEHLRLTPFAPMDRPLWGVCLRWLVAVPPVSAWLLANGLSVLLGAMAAGLLGRLVAYSLPDEKAPQVQARSLSSAMGFSAAVILATAAPFWLVSNRAHPATLGLCLLLLALNLLQHYRLTSSGRALAAGLVVYGLGLAELPSLLLMAPFVAGEVLLVMWQKRHLQPGRLAGLALLGCVPVVVWLLAAQHYAGLPAAGWREMTSLGDAWRAQMVLYRDILLRSLPKQGWLLLLFACVLPWLITLLVIRRRSAQRATWEIMVLMLLVTAALVAVFWNAPFAPWSMFGTQPLLVTPYVLAAASLVYAFTFWCQLLAQKLSRPFFPWLPVLLVVTALTLAGLSARRNRELVSTAAAQPVLQLTQAMLDHLEGRDFLVASGILTDSIRLARWQSGVPLTIVDLPISDYSGYRRYLSSLFPDPRQQGLALAGLAPVLVDWLDTGTGAVERLALQGSPDLWLGEGYEPLPMASVYLGARQVTTQDVRRVQAAVEAFWPHAQTWLDAWQRASPRQQSQARALSAYLARVANDTGVFFERYGERKLARAAYAQARRLAPENLSAAANLVVLGQAAGWTGIDLEEAELALAVAPRGLSLRETVGRYGHLRLREAAQLLELSGPLSGASPQTDAVWADVVASYFKGERSETRRRVEKLVAERPEFDPAWILLATLAYEQGDEALLQKCIRQMRELRRDWPELAILLGRQALDRQDLAAARACYERAAQLRPGDLSILELLLQLDLREQDLRRAEARVRQILALRPSSIHGQLGLAVILRAQKRYELAEQALQRVLEVQRHPMALSELALLRLQAGKVEEARRLAEEAIAMDGRQAAGHAALGRAALAEGKAAEAVEDLTRALAIDGENGPAQVYLAQALAQAGRRSEARVLVRDVRKKQMNLDPDLREILDQLAD